MSDHDHEDERDLEQERLAAIERAKEDEEKRRKQELLDEAYREVMKTRAGRLVMWDRLGRLGLYKTPMVVGARDLTYANIGTHNAALELLTDLNAIAPDEALLMHKENMK